MLEMVRWIERIEAKLKLMRLIIKLQQMLVNCRTSGF